MTIMESLLQTLERIQTRVDSEWPTLLKKELIEGRASLDVAASVIRAHGFTVSAFEETLLRCVAGDRSRSLS
jgi:hypothetical protein